MTHESHQLDSNELVDRLGDRSAIFQDCLNAGFELPEVEDFSDWARAEGFTPITVSTLHELTTHDTYGRLARLTLDAALGRLMHEL